MHSEQPLDGMVAIVTGAGRGIGRAEALQLAAAGAAVVVNDKGVAVDGSGGDAGPASEVAAEIRASGGRAVANLGDVGDSDDAEALIAQAISEFGRLDILVNNAGIITGSKVLPDLTIEEYDRLMHVHVRGSFCTSIAATRYWRERFAAGDVVAASVINTASLSYLIGSPWRPTYAAAKAAIVALTVSTSKIGEHFGVRANAICPKAYGRMSSFRPPREGAVATTPEQVATQAPDDVAPLVVALASGATSITGQVFSVHDTSIGIIRAPEIAATLTSDTRWTVAEVTEKLADYFSTQRPDYGHALPEYTQPYLRELIFGAASG